VNDVTLTRYPALQGGEVHLGEKIFFSEPWRFVKGVKISGNDRKKINALFIFHETSGSGLPVPVFFDL
jgi:hypothetical protein